MNNKSKMGKILPIMAMDEIPEPKEDAKAITALVKDSGRIVGYQLSDNTIVDKQQGVELAKQGNIRGVGIAHRNETEYLKAIPDGEESTNLGNLPSIPKQNF